MATLLSFSNSSFIHLTRHHAPPPSSSLQRRTWISTPISFSTTQYLTIKHERGRGRGRGVTVVTRAGPSSSSLIFAFVLPISLLAVTIFASARIADKLDQKFLEEQAVNQEILEANEDDENDDNDDITVEPEPAPPRTRNRPKREVEPSSTS